METNRKLNIAMVCDPMGEYKAGVIVSTIRFAKILKEKGHHVIFIGAKDKKNKEHGYHDGIKTYRFRSIPLPKSGGWHLAFPSAKELRKVFMDEKIDVVHIILPMSAALTAVKVARSLGIKIVAHSHSQPENLFMEAPRFLRPVLNNLWNRWLAWVYNKAESIIYPSEMAHKLLEKLSRRGQPYKVISNGINTTEFTSLPIGDFYERFNVPLGTVKLVFVGRLFPEKSVDTLIMAVPHILRKHPNTHVMLVGGGHQRPKLEKLVDVLEVRKNVTFLGLVSEQDKIHAYNASDIFVLPSLAELEGMVVLEAMACGKPIIISDAEMSASKYFVEGNGFLFETLNPEHLAEQALKLITDVELRRAMGAVSLEKSKKYDIQASAEKLLEVYYSALRI